MPQPPTSLPASSRRPRERRRTNSEQKATHPMYPQPRTEARAAASLLTRSVDTSTFDAYTMRLSRGTHPRDSACVIVFGISRNKIRLQSRGAHPLAPRLTHPLAPYATCSSYETRVQKRTPRPSPSPSPRSSPREAEDEGSLLNRSVRRQLSLSRARAHERDERNTPAHEVLARHSRLSHSRHDKTRATLTPLIYAPSGPWIDRNTPTPSAKHLTDTFTKRTRPARSRLTLRCVRGSFERNISIDYLR
jgi:hypothetical protein